MTNRPGNLPNVLKPHIMFFIDLSAIPLSRKSSLFCQFYHCLGAAMFMYTHLEQSWKWVTTPLGQTGTFWERICSTGERTIQKDIQGLLNKIVFPVYISCLSCFGMEVRQQQQFWQQYARRSGRRKSGRRSGCNHLSYLRKERQPQSTSELLYDQHNQPSQQDLAQCYPQLTQGQGGGTAGRRTSRF